MPTNLWVSSCTGIPLPGIQLVKGKSPEPRLCFCIWLCTGMAAVAGANYGDEARRRSLALALQTVDGRPLLTF